MQPLSADSIQHNLFTRTFGQTVIYYGETGSTNTELKNLARVDAPEGTLVIADSQIAGRGRFARRWVAPARSGLLASLLFRPTFLPSTAMHQLTMICSLAAIEAIRLQTGVSVEIKWPNDLIYQDRKLAGVLTEAGFTGDAIDWVIVGMGLNVNVDFSALSQADSPDLLPLKESATSLQMILGGPVPRIPLLQSYLLEVEKRFQALKAGNSPHQAWASKITTLGKDVTVTTSERTFHGVAKSVDEDGALLIHLPGGSVERVLAGDITLR